MSDKHAFQTVQNCFMDTLCEADELIGEGRLTADDVINAFAAAFTSEAKYYSDKAKIYDDILFAISQRGRNK